MNWPVIQALAMLAPLPAGYRYGRIDTAHVPEVIRSLDAWYPEIRVGVSSCYLREDFYRERVNLDGDLDRHIYAARILHGDEMVGFWSFEREIDSLAIYGRLMIVAPHHRGATISRHTMAGTEALGRAMGAAFMYTMVTLRDPYAQRMLESAGYRLLGFFPGRDREEVSPGVVKRVYQGVYAKLLVPADRVHWPEDRNLSPRARALFQMMFPDRP